MIPAPAPAPAAFIASSKSINANSSNSSTRSSLTVNYNPSVSRSAELLSCARTALKIAQSRHAKGVTALVNNNGSSNNNHWFLNVNPADLELYNPQNSQNSQNNAQQNGGESPQVEIAQDGLTLLHSMESQLSLLEQLVRRRGHTNDPTEEIGITVQRLEQDAKELATVIATLAPTRNYSMQRRRHCEAVQQWFQHAAQERATRLKQILAVRGTVLQEQAERRRRFQTTTVSKNTTTSGSQQQQQQHAQQAAANALFSLPPPLPPVTKPKFSTANPPAHQSFSQPTTTATAGSTSTATTSSTSTMYTSYPSTGAVAGRTPHRMPLNYGGATAYGGTTSRRANASLYAGPSHSATVGMRQRRGAGNSDNTRDSDYHYQQQQQLLQERQQERQTARRRQEAQQAEKSLAELGTVFGKMATLIQQQSDVLETIEDDVEAAAFDVRAGQNEITTLYSLKKGNRALILKVFGLLIFFIVFMRLYVRK